MHKLPNAELAVVPKEKVTRYLLDPTHPAGGSKAVFFLRFGFLASEWRILVQALLEHGRNNNVGETEDTAWGRRYEVDGPLDAPDGTILNVRTVWYIDGSNNAPRLVTAYPLPKP